MSKIIDVNKGDVIFKEGAFELWMYRIVSGKVFIVKNYGLETEEILAELVAEGIFGEMGLIDFMPRSATAIAAENCALEKIDDKDFKELINKKPEVICDLIITIGEKINATNEKYQSLCSDIKAYVGDGSKDESLLKRIVKWLTVSVEETQKYYVNNYDVYYLNDPNDGGYFRW